MTNDTSKPQSKNPLLNKLLSMSVQDDKTKPITVYPLLVEFLGSLEAGMLLSQLLYWTIRSAKKPRVAKSDKDFQKELCLKRYSIRKARELLLHRGLIETYLEKWDGAPTIYYLVKLAELNKQWIEFLRLSENEQSIVRKRTMENTKTNNPLSESAQSLTETTSEIANQRLQQKEREGTGATAPVFSFYESEFGKIQNFMKSILTNAIAEYSEDWVLDALKETVKHNKQSVGWIYVETILKRWKKDGKVKTIGNKSSSKMPSNTVNLSSPNFGKGEPKGFANLTSNTHDATRAAAQRIIAKKRKKELEEKNMVVL